MQACPFPLRRWDRSLTVAALIGFVHPQIAQIAKEIYSNLILGVRWVTPRSARFHPPYMYALLFYALLFYALPFGSPLNATDLSPLNATDLSPLNAADCYR